MNTIMLELMDELVDPLNAVLDDQIEKALDDEYDILSGVSDFDDEIICFIDKGERISIADPMAITDDEVDDAIYDDLEV